MKYFFLSIFLIFKSLNPQAQSFSGSGGVIYDNATSVYFNLNLTELEPALLDSNYGLMMITVNITHPRTSDLKLSLIAPDGTLVILSEANGDYGANYSFTKFADTANRSIMYSSAPFYGYFKPQQPLGTINNGQDGNGIWKLKIKDLNINGLSGYLNGWSLTFNANPSTPFVFTSSNLPIFIIDTYGIEIPDDPKIKVGLKVVDNPSGVRNFVTDTPAYNGFAGIEIRGSSSQMFPKKSFGLETWDALSEEIDVPLLGMPAESDWILNANYTDKSLIRNTLAYNVFQKMGHYATKYEYVEVVLNDVYQGVYVFSEKIKRDSQRVNIAKLESDQNTGDALTGGYIVKIDKTTGSGGAGWVSNYPPLSNPNNQTIFFQYEYPKAENITVQQKSYIQDYINAFEIALKGPAFADTAIGFRKYADENSFIDYFIVNEISKNVDGYRLSTFIHKDRDSRGGKLQMGPVWDYDIAWRNADYCGGDIVTGFAYQFPCSGDFWQPPFWWNRLLQDFLFTSRLKCRWQSLRAGILSDYNFERYIDSISATIDEGQQRNFNTWPILGSYVWPNPQPIPTTYSGEVQALKNFIHSRLAWLDQNMPGTCSAIGISESTLDQFQWRVFPNPATNELHIECNTCLLSFVDVHISDLCGRIIMKQHYSPTTIGTFNRSIDIHELANGIYLLHINHAKEQEVKRFVVNGR